ncbi:HPP family protein [Pseudomonas citronellolis]|uniref:HPP family protein n=1 Tax=Pseudomonas citronellolis TaxID=53408 RepID=A0AAW6P7S8_9PSED|nr:HPP family protein [Pseudomonas citronellolis]MDF3843067.1 HPP family protein [Pseudomonas citronellolis]
MKAAAFGSWLHRLAPCAGPSSNRDWLRAVLGCGFALGLCMPLCAWLFGVDTMLRIGPPLAASALLAIAVPSSPLAQPWSLLGGNLVAALVGLLLGHWLGHSWPQASLSMVVAVLLMLGLRCLHPPSTAMAFSLAVGGQLVDQHLLHLLLPVGVASLALIGVALVYNNLTRAPYPRKLAVPASNPHLTADPLPGERLGLHADDLESALASAGGFVDVTPEDLERLLLAAEKHASERLLGGIRARDIMSRDIRSVSPDARIEEAWGLLDKHHLKALPVLDRGHLVGILTLSDLFRGQRRLRSPFGQRVGNLMTHRVQSLREDAQLPELIQLLSDQGRHCLPVVDGAGRLVGMLSQTDLIAAFRHLWLQPQVQAERALQVAV